MIYRVLRTAKATLSRTFTTDDVESIADGVVSVTVLRLDGTVVNGPTNATGPVGSVYTYAFPGRDVLDTLVVQWSLTIGGDAQILDQDSIEVVGGVYFPISQGRSVNSALANTTKYPTPDLVQARVEVESECERITGQAWVPRFARAVVSGTDQRVLILPNTVIRSVRSLTVNGVVQSTSGLRFTSGGALSYDDTGRTWRWGHGNIVVEYEHGRDRPDPEIVRAALLRFKSIATEDKAAVTDRAERTITVDTNGGSIVYGSPTREKTGLPAVDAVYGRYDSPRPGFG